MEDVILKKKDNEAENININNQVNTNNNANQQGNQSSKNTNKRLAIILIVIGLALVGIAVYKLFIEKPQDDNTKDNGNNSTIVSGEQIYKTKDGKYTFKLLENGKAFINDKEVIVSDKEDNNKYIEIVGDFDPSPAFISGLGFVLDKETKLIVESSYYDETDKSSECGFDSYGEYARFCTRCYGLKVLNVNNWYFFEIPMEMGSSDIYTTSWKKLGSADVDKIKYDEEGIYVCNEPFESTCKSGETKYDVNGNIINNSQNTTPKGTTNKLAANTTYTSRDGKETFTITKIEEYDEGTTIRAKYQNAMYTFYADDYSYMEDRYLSSDGEPDVGGGGQCLTAGVVLNLKTKTLERISTKGMKFYNVIKGGGGYFFTETECLGGYDRTLYDNNWNKLGRLIGYEADDQGNIYAYNNGKIVKYSYDGNKISETSTTAKYVGPAVIYNNTLYYMGEESSGGYLYNNDTNEKYKLYDQSIDFKEDRYPYSGLDVEALTNIILENNKILIRYESDEVGYTFDPNTKQLTKIN